MSAHDLLRAAAILIALPLYALPAVRAWQDTITLPTYLEGRPDVSPGFDAPAPKLAGAAVKAKPDVLNTNTESTPIVRGFPCKSATV